MSTDVWNTMHFDGWQAPKQVHVVYGCSTAVQTALEEVTDTHPNLLEHLYGTRPSTTIRMCRTKSIVKKLSKQPCTALKCAKCLQAGQRPDRKRCTTLGCPCKCPRFIGIPTQQLQKGEPHPARMCTRSQTMIKKDTGMTVVDATPSALTASTRRSSTSSTSTGDVSSMISSSDEGEMEGEIPKASLQTYSIPGSLLAAGATPLAITLQHCAHAGSVMILAHSIN